DLTVNGEKLDLSHDPGWEAHQNHGEFPETRKRPLHDFGFSPTTHATLDSKPEPSGSAAGPPGEIGGVIWRAGIPMYYADAAGPFTLDDRLHASGTIALVAAAADSGASIGFFNA